MKDKPDKLPPHSPEMEKGILGCILMDPATTMPAALERIGEEEGVFYDLRHETVWHSLKYLHSKSEGIDIFLLAEELKTRGKLEQVGGIFYLSEMQNKVPSAANLEFYLSIVWEKYIARTLIQQSVGIVGEIFDTGELTEPFLAMLERRGEVVRQLLERGNLTPKYLKKPVDFAEAFYDRFFNPKRDDEYGLALPFNFPLRLRPAEETLFTGDNGSGKSSMLSQIAINCAVQYQKEKRDGRIVIASMEVPPEVTLWIMARQLLGVGELAANDDNRRLAAKALGWLNSHMLLYDFLGITDWRELLNTFRYAQKHEHGEIFIVDSVMRIGIPDDDYATQGLAAAQFADFCVKTKTHTFLVVHENKGEAKNKDRIRGSKQWSDNASNVCGMKRNEDKVIKLEELDVKLKTKEINEAQHKEKTEALLKQGDAKFLLYKQRWPGSQQNGSKRLWFHKESLQFHTEPDQEAIQYLKP